MGNPMSSNAMSATTATSFHVRPWVARTKPCWRSATFLIAIFPIDWAALRFFTTDNWWYWGILCLFSASFPWPWTWDVLSGLYHPVVIPIHGTNPGDGEMSFWHVSSRDPEVFSPGIRFDVARITFLGEGFYTWQRREDCARMWARQPKTILQITVPHERWATLKVSEISSKWSWRYVMVNHL